MQEAIRPGDMIVPDQIFDRTRGQRPSTFFGDGIAGHVMFADPFCETLRGVVMAAAQSAGANVHEGGTYLCMEGTGLFHPRRVAFLPQRRGRGRDRHDRSARG